MRICITIVVIIIIIIIYMYITIVTMILRTMMARPALTESVKLMIIITMYNHKSVTNL